MPALELMNTSRLSLRSAYCAVCFSVLVSACVSDSKPVDRLAEEPTEILNGDVAEQSETSVLFARFVPERADDFAWENDVIAFRAYGPVARGPASNSGVDCWLKRVEYPIINKWYDLALNHGQSYHEDRGEGLDNYKVGPSLGCGSTALWLDGVAMPLGNFVQWSDIETGSDSLSFKLHYEREINGHVYTEAKHIRLLPSVRLFEVSSSFFKDGKPASDMPVAVGITSHKGKAELNFDSDARWVSAWEQLDDHGLGTATVLGAAFKAKAVTAGIETAADDPHGLLVTATNSKGQLRYFVGYGWEKAGVIKSFADWKAYLDQFNSTKPYDTESK